MIPELGRTPSLGVAGYGAGQMAGDAAESARGQAFQDLLQRAVAKVENPSKSTGKDQKSQLVEAARQMEIQLATLMLKTMETSSTEHGLLGDSNSAGLAHFKDLFLGQVAEQLVERQGFGFADALLTSYGVK